MRHKLRAAQSHAIRSNALKFSPRRAGQLSAWFEAATLSSLFQDDAGSSPVTTNGQSVGKWTDLSGNGRHVLQATAGNRAIYQTALPSVKFDGSNDYLSYAGALTDVVGSVVALFKTGTTSFATKGSQVLVSAADNGTANNWFEIGIDSDGRIYIESNVGGTKHTVVGSSFLANSTSYLLTVTHDGTDYYAMLNSIEQNPLMITNVGTFAWFGDVSSADNLVIGGTVTSAGIVRSFDGDIMMVAIYAEDITQ